jgi:hypothetical protein
VYVQALGAPTFEGLGARLDDDAHFTFPGNGDVYQRGSIVRALDRLFGAFEQRHASVNRIWSANSEETVDWTLVGVQARDWMGIAATHRPVIIHGLTLMWTKDDGTITDMHVYFDVAAVKAQLGVGPQELVSQAVTPSLGSYRSATGAEPLIFDQTGNANEQSNVVQGRALLDALETNSLAAYVGLMSDGVEIFTLERGQPWRGKADATAYFKAMHAAIGQLDTTVTDAWGVDQFAILEYTLAGEQLGAVGWVRPQPEVAIRFHIVDVIEIQNGQIVRIWRFDNPAEVVGKNPTSSP